jgi:hydroxymethylpyrimidine pyrophosphatase-like HAD family hydrolase
MREGGLTVKVSSIHVNGWFGDYDKLSMARTLMRECFAIDLDAEKDRFVFVGDSPNDAPMFGYFPHSIGVANIRAFAAQLPAAPAYVTQAASGAGFCELVDVLLAGR